jgi:hypothetical protein
VPSPPSAAGVAAEVSVCHLPPPMILHSPDRNASAAIRVYATFVAGFAVFKIRQAHAINVLGLGSGGRTDEEASAAGPVRCSAAIVRALACICRDLAAT